MEECGPTKTQEILVSHTDIVQSPLIELGLFAMGPQRPEQAGHRFDDLTELVFALPKSLLRLSPIIDIDQDAIPTQAPRHRWLAMVLRGPRTIDIDRPLLEFCTLTS